MSTDQPVTDVHGDGGSRGREPTAHGKIPRRGWTDVLARTKAEAKTDNVALLAAGIVFYTLPAPVPALVAFVSIYGLVADPGDVGRHIGDLLGAAPREVRDLLETQLEGITEDHRTQAGIGAILGVLVAVWSASSGVKHAIEGVNTAYDENETRGFLRVRLLALVLTVGAVGFGLVMFFVIAIAPAALAESTLSDTARLVFGILRWPCSPLRS